MASWWFEHRIDATLTRQYVDKHLHNDARRLDEPVAFGGEDLTENTYWESITSNAKRMFLILIDIGIPNHIFSVIDNARDDRELPLDMDEIRTLGLTQNGDERLDRRFYQRQFHYLLMPLEPGEHQDYKDPEVVPLEVVDRVAHLGPRNNHVDRVKLPDVPNRVFIRRKWCLVDSGSSSGSSNLSRNEFSHIVRALQHIEQHPHMVSYWASYTHHNTGYILMDPGYEFSLKAFFSSTPASFKALSKVERAELLMNWILCLLDAVCSLHSRSLSHYYIKPASIMFNHQNSIRLIDTIRLSPESSSAQMKKESFDREWYDYAPPEQWARKIGPGIPPTRQERVDFLLGTYNSDSINMFGPIGSHNPNTFNAPGNVDLPFRAPSFPSNPSQRADIFSLGCIILELLSYLLKHTGKEFATFRSAKHKKGGRPMAPLDTSFHRNLGQVELWMRELANEADTKSKSSDCDEQEANILKGVLPMLHIVSKMLDSNPMARLPAVVAYQEIYRILHETCGMTNLHVVNEHPSIFRRICSYNPQPRQRFDSAQTQPQFSLGEYHWPENARLARQPTNGSNSTYPRSRRSHASMSSNITAESDDGEIQPYPSPQSIRSSRISGHPDSDVELYDNDSGSGSMHEHDKHEHNEYNNNLHDNRVNQRNTFIDAD